MDIRKLERDNGPNHISNYFPTTLPGDERLFDVEAIKG